MPGSVGVRSLTYSRLINWGAPLNQGLLGWWLTLPWLRVGPRLLDVTGRYPAGAINMAPGVLSTGRPGGWGALPFDGTTNHMDVPNLNLTTSSLTLMAWVKPTLIRSVIRQQFTGYIILGYISTGHLLSTDGALLHGLSEDSTWQHTAFTYRPNTAAGWRSFRNGVLGATATSTTLPTNHLGLNLTFGAYPGGGEDFAGVMDDWRIYSRALSDEEVWEVYQASLQGYPRELNWRTFPPVLTTTPPAGRITKNTRSFMLGMLHGMERRLGIGRPGMG
jgi:hypothetical protein